MMKKFDTIAIEFDLTNLEVKKIPIDELSINPEDKSKIYWIHSNLNQPQEFKKIVQHLQLPEHVQQFCTDERNLSNIIDSKDTLTLQVKCISTVELKENFEPHFDNLTLYLTTNYCFTASDYDLPVLFEFLDGCPKAIHYAKTPCFILFLFLEGIINDYSKILLNYEEIVDYFDTLVETRSKDLYKEITELKHKALKIKRYIITIREILVRITGRSIQVISDPCRASLHNLSNHSHLLIKEIDSIREQLNSFLAQIDNELIQKISETMKVLTSFAAIFLPLHLIAGIYGMNFLWMPELHWKYGYLWALFLIGTVGLCLFFFFRKKKWL